MNVPDATEGPPSQPPTIYAPFDEPDNVDMILRSSSGEDFHTRRILLSLASDVFDAMITLPQPRQGEARSGEFDGPPVIELVEESYTIYQLLRWLDPRCTPSWGLEDMQLVLGAADKYNMQGVMLHIEQVLTRCTEYVDADPVRIYAIALRYGFYPLARGAAKESLRLAPEGRINLPELAFISGQALQNLYTYYFACAKAAQEVATDFKFGWLGSKRFTWGPDSPGYHSSCSAATRSKRAWQMWWVEYMEIAAQELHKCPRGLTVKAIPHFATKPLEAAVECSTCRSTAYSDLLKFNEIFGEEVERRISKIALVIT